MPKRKVKSSADADDDLGSDEDIVLKKRKTDYNDANCSKRSEEEGTGKEAKAKTLDACLLWEDGRGSWKEVDGYEGDIRR